MKKIILLTVIALTATAGGGNAQTALDFRYCSGENINSVISATAGSYTEAAIYIPRDVAAKYSGNSITKIKVGWGQHAPQGNARVFIRTALAGNPAPVYEQTASVYPNSWNEITLDTPFPITGTQDLYVGYSFTAGNSAGICKAIGTDNAANGNVQGNWVKYGAETWSLLSNRALPQNRRSNANLMIKATVEGENFPAYDIAIQDITFPVTVNDSLAVLARIKNFGLNTVTALNVSNLIAGGGDSELRAFANLNIEPMQEIETVFRNFGVNKPDGNCTSVITVENINGQADAYPDDNVKAGQFNFLAWEAPATPAFVTTDAKNRNAVIEEYTGLNCTNCPLGHKLINEIAEAYPDRVVALNIHQGDFAAPQNSAQPDYRTDYGDALAAQTDLLGWPSGTVNRHVFFGTATAIISSDNNSNMRFNSAASQVMNSQSYVNMAIRTAIDKAARQLTVDVEMYYTANGAPVNYLNVALLEDSIMGYQSGMNSYPAMVRYGKYQHNHMLRDMLTKQWGDPIFTTAEGSFVAKRYQYTIPENYRQTLVNLDKLNTVAFITEGHQEIVTGVSDLFSSEPAGTENLFDNGVHIYIANNYIIINSENTVTNIEIFNINGQKIFSQTMPAKRLLAQNLPAGIYLAKIQTQAGVKIQKIVKK